MSDFIAHLLDRHLGKGEQVLPRARSRFEPNAAAAFLPQEIEEDSNHTPTYAETSSVNSPAPDTAPDTPAVNSSGDDNPIKQPVHHQNQPGSVIEAVEVRTKIAEPESGPVSQPISAAPVEADIYNSKASPHEPLIPADPAQESVPKNEDVSREKPAAHKYTIKNKNRWERNLENRPDNILQTVSQRLLPLVEQDHPVRSERPGYPEQIVTVNHKMQEGPNNRQFHRQAEDIPMEFIESGSAGPAGAESQPITPTFQNTGSDSRDFPAAAASLSHTYQPVLLEPLPSPELPVNGRGQETIRDTGTGSPGILEAPAWLSRGHNELHKELFLNDSKAETQPVINVTIGRIEVRAVKQQEPPPPRRFVSPKPKLSLDDYLEQRNRGEI